MNTRNRGHDGYIPTPAEVRNARADLSQDAAAAMIYTTGRRWRSYESGESRIHPGLWELFNIKRTGK